MSTYREPLRDTILRNGAVALVAGAVFARFQRGIARWPAATLLMIWPSFGGHWVEVFFLNVLRPRLPSTRAVQIVARLAFWFLAGAVLGICMRLTAQEAGFALLRRLDWWVAGLAFVLIELVAHLAVAVRGKPNFYDARG